MVSRIRIGPEGGPFVEIDEDNGTLDLNAPSGDIDIQSNDFLNIGALSAAVVQATSVQDDTGSVMLTSVVDSGQVALSNNLAEVSTGISATDATFMLALGVDDPNADAEVAGALYWDDSLGQYEVRIRETETNVNPTVNYDIIRVR
jgi:hypothetical protein